MKVLAIDTSSPMGSVAISDGEDIVAEVAARVRARHGETLLPHVESALASADLEAKDLELLAVGLGPGSFTGTRIGVATVKGLALGLGLPVVGISSLRVLARAVAGPGAHAVPVADAGRGEVYFGVYEAVGAALNELSPPLAAAPEEAARVLADRGPLWLCGDGAWRYREKFAGLEGSLVAGPAFSSPRAAHLVAAALAAHGSRGADDLGTLEPLYVRPSDAKLPQKPLRVGV